VILAAGAGRRIGRLGQRYPKALLPVLGRPIISWQLEALKRHGIDDAVIVVGHLGESIRAALGDGSERGMRLVYREQTEPNGIAHALSFAQDAIEGPFVLLLGDIFFAPGDLEGVLSLLRAQDNQGVLVVQHESDLDQVRKNFTVELAEDGPRAGFVERVIEKPQDPVTTLKGTGLYAFDPGIFDAIDGTPRSSLRNEYELTDAIQVFVDRGAKLRTFETSARDFNLSEVRDLLQLNLHALKGEGLENFVEPTASVGKRVQLERSVVLAGATIESSARLSECLVFPGERVRTGDYSCTVFAGGSSIRCEPGVT